MLQCRFAWFRIPPQFILHPPRPGAQAAAGLTGWTFATAEAIAGRSPLPGEAPEALAARLAQAKAQAVARAGSSGASWVLAADTVVVDQGRLLGKPDGDQEALAMLSALRGRRHQVITGIAILNPVTGGLQSETCHSDVPMRSYSPAEAEAYVARGAALDKAGGYGIQDQTFRPVDMDLMRDCYANVMGLPLCHLVRAMHRLGLEPLSDVPEACQAHTQYRCPVYAEILEGGRSPGAAGIHVPAEQMAMRHLQLVGFGLLCPPAAGRSPTPATTTLRPTGVDLGERRIGGSRQPLSASLAGTRLRGHVRHAQPAHP
jgi:MAF protein